MNLGTRRATTALVVVILTASCLAATTSAASPDSNWLPEIKASDQLTGPVLLRGRVVDKAGRSAAGRVTVVAWPPQEVLGPLKNGDSVKTAAVGKAIAGPDGAFTLRVDPSAPLAEFADKNGTVNFDVWSQTSDGVAVYSFPRKLDPAVSTAWVDPARPIAKGAALNEGPLEMTLAPDPKIDPALGESTAAPASSRSCQETVIATYNQRIGIVGEAYAGPHSTADFQYKNGSSSTLGVAFDAAGGAISYSFNGTATTSSTSTIDYPTLAANGMRVFQTTFQYKKFSSSCIAGLIWVYVGDFVRPTAFQGGVSTYNAAGAPTATNCSNISVVPTTITKETAGAVTFTNGIKLSSVIGIDLSSKTGFTTSTKIVHKFTSAGKLCGSNAAWPDAARIVGK